jgi:hypothetical protein
LRKENARLASEQLDMGFYVLFYFSENMTDNYRKITNVVIMTSFGFIILVFPSCHIFGILGAVAPSIYENIEFPYSFLFLKSGKLEHGHPLSSGGDNLYEGTLFQVLYPSNWIKEDIPLVRYTALESLPEVAFYVPNQNVEVIISTERPGNVLLSEYFSREVISLQDSVTGYESVGSSKTKLGNVTALEVSYISSMVEEGTIYGQTKTMELVTIFQGVSYFFIYRAEVSEYSKYLPAVQEMIRSFVFKRA